MKNPEHEISLPAEGEIMLTDNGKTKNENNSKFFAIRQPPDGGYSWVILVSGFFLVVLLSSTGSLFTLIFIQKVNVLKMSSFSISLAFNFRSFIWNVACTMSGPLCDKLGWRKVGITGAFMCSLSFFCCTYTNSVLALNVYFSFLNGFGGGLAFSTCLFAVANYFVKLRGLAMAIMGSGYGTGQLILPLFITYLQENYGFHWAALIFSAFLLNGVISATLFHPIEWHQETPGRNQLAKIDCDLNEVPHLYEGKLNIICSRTRIRCLQLNEMIRTVLKLTYFNIVNLRSPVVAIISLSGGCKIIAFLNIILMLPLSFVSKGITLQETAYCLSVTGTSILIFRLITPILSDFKAFNTTFFYVTGHLIIAISCFAFTFVSQFFYIAICFGFFGIGIGASMGLQPIIFIDYKGLKQLPQTYGSFGFVNALLFVSVGIPLGYVRDATNSYTLMYRLFSGVLLFSALIWIFMPCALSYERRKLKEAGYDSEGVI